MNTILICALGVLLVLVLVGESLPMLSGFRGLRIAMGIIFAAANLCYALWAGADVFAWDFPTRLALSGCLFPVLTLLENKLPHYKKMLVWALTAVYAILLILTAYKG